MSAKVQQKENGALSPEEAQSEHWVIPAHSLYHVNVYYNFTNFRCIKILVASDHKAFSLVWISVPMDAAVITECIFLI